MSVDQVRFTNKYIAHLLRSIAAVYLITDEIRFKIIAYENAADAVEHLSRELKSIWEDQGTTKMSGIGPSISAHLDEYFKLGHSKHFDDVLKNVPETVFELMKIPSIGPKKAFKLVKALKLVDKTNLISDLKKACLEGKVGKIPTFGKKSEEDILKSVELFENRKTGREERMPISYAMEIADRIIKYLNKNSKVEKVDILGSLRRMVPTIGDIDMAVSALPSDTSEIIKYFVDYPDKIKVDNAGEKKASIVVPPSVKVDIRVQEEENYGPMLQYFTGSKNHNILLREFALKKGYSLSEYGIKNLKKKDSPIIEFKTEEELYKFLGSQYIPPEIREGTNEIKLAAENKIPKLVEVKDIKGDFHIHSNYDLSPSHDLGADNYLDIFKTGMSLGYEYVGFADHNPRISNNTPDNIIAIMKRRKEYIDEVMSTNKIEQSKYFIGLEVDILPDGQLALPIKAIEYVDYLIVSIHSSFKMDTQDMTKRVLKAFTYPKVKIFGHPTGRLLTKREGYQLDWDKIFEASKDKNIAMEINSWVLRLDLPDILVRQAIDKGVKLFINTDSHIISQMNSMFFGVSVARRGWCQKSDIINTGTAKEVRDWINRG